MQHDYVVAVFGMNSAFQADQRHLFPEQDYDQQGVLVLYTPAHNTQIRVASQTKQGSVRFS